MKTSAHIAVGLTLLGAVVLGAAPFGCSLDASGLTGASASASSSDASSGSGSASASSSAASGMGGASASSASATSSTSGGGGAGGGTMVGATCDAIHKADSKALNGVYTLDPDGPGGVNPFKAYCEMAADGGGWTLALKIDGTQPTFAYDAQPWKDDTPYQANQPDLDTTEAKLATFSTVSFTAVRLGMIDAAKTRWITISLPMSYTLSTLISGGNYTATTIGRSEWEKLVASPSLQFFCNAEGFNVDPSNYARARIGIVANEQMSCISPDSFIGFGAEDGHGLSGTGNFASYSPEHGDRTTTTFGYVMVR